MRASIKGLVLAVLFFSQLLHQCCCGPVEGGRSLTLKALGQREDGQEVGDTRPERQRLPLGPGEAGGRERPKRFLGAIGRAIGKAVKKVGKAVSNVAKGAKKVVKKVTKYVLPAVIENYLRKHGKLPWLYFDNRVPWEG